MRLNLDRVARRNPIGDPFGEPLRKRPPRFVNRVGIRIERENIRRVGSDTDREPAVSAAQLEDVAPAKVRQAVKAQRDESLPDRGRAAPSCGLFSVGPRMTRPPATACGA